MPTAPLTNTSLKPPDLKDLGIHHDLIKANVQSAINNFHASLIPALHNQAYPPVAGYTYARTRADDGERVYGYPLETTKPEDVARVFTTYRPAWVLTLRAASTCPEAS